ncbi:glycine-rich RNA-binding protein 4, mitochondrial-like [Impatiens glandulifera]|uniref:glycine-rich RNA-binding protein 4, mitochondrial-like n=1 Tax=Impatiens glandulifera TaxID=253017 RepID=UPI001FB17F60|nr:glycine-rich RNA-binding protein 4, mitochondrial-like [Impatiens glandulifera]
MAFCNKLGGFMRKTVLHNVGSIGKVGYFPSAIRCLSTKLFIGGLSYGTDDKSLMEAFSSFGDVSEAKIITDRETGRSRGFGFVNFVDNESASAALQAMDGQPLQGRNVRVSYATERQGPPRSNYGSGGGWRE